MSELSPGGPDLAGTQGEKEDALLGPHKAEEEQRTERGQRLGSGQDRLAHGGADPSGKGQPDGSGNGVNVRRLIQQGTCASKVCCTFTELA